MTRRIADAAVEVVLAADREGVPALLGDILDRGREHCEAGARAAAFDRRRHRRAGLRRDERRVPALPETAAAAAG